MTMAKKGEPTSVFEQIQAGLEDSIAFSRGELSLATTELPAPPPKPAPRQIAALRKEFRMSQAVFAATLNVSKKTVQSWEQGLREPSDASVRMLQVIRMSPQVVTDIFAVKGSQTRHPAAAGRKKARSTKRAAR